MNLTSSNSETQWTGFLRFTKRLSCSVDQEELLLECFFVRAFLCVLSASNFAGGFLQNFYLLVHIKLLHAIFRNNNSISQVSFFLLVARNVIHTAWQN